MIYYALPGHSVGPPAVSIVAEQALLSQVYQNATALSPPVEIRTPKLVRGNAELKLLVEAVEHFDWSRPGVNRNYIHLEQKVLAKKATQEEVERYRMMKSDRNSLIFADRYVRDYAEVQRLKRLSEKLAEIQRDLRPISL